MRSPNACSCVQSEQRSTHCGHSMQQISPADQYDSIRTVVPEGKTMWDPATAPGPVLSLGLDQIVSPVLMDRTKLEPYTASELTGVISAPFSFSAPSSRSCPVAL